MPLGPLCDTRLQSALNRIASHVVSPIRQPELHERGRFAKPESGELLEIPTIH